MNGLGVTLAGAVPQSSEGDAAPKAPEDGAAFARCLVAQGQVALRETLTAPSALPTVATAPAASESPSPPAADADAATPAPEEGDIDTPAPVAIGWTPLVSPWLVPVAPPQANVAPLPAKGDAPAAPPASTKASPQPPPSALSVPRKVPSWDDFGGAAVAAPVPATASVEAPSPLPPQPLAVAPSLDAPSALPSAPPPAAAFTPASAATGSTDAHASSGRVEPKSPAPGIAPNSLASKLSDASPQAARRLPVDATRTGEPPKTPRASLDAGTLDDTSPTVVDASPRADTATATVPSTEPQPVITITTGSHRWASLDVRDAIDAAFAAAPAPAAPAAPVDPAPPSPTSPIAGARIDRRVEPEAKTKPRASRLDAPRSAKVAADDRAPSSVAGARPEPLHDASASPNDEVSVEPLPSEPIAQRTSNTPTSTVGDAPADSSATARLAPAKHPVATTSGAAHAQPSSSAVSLTQRQTMVDHAVNRVALRGPAEGQLTTDALGTVKVSARELDGGVKITVHAAEVDAGERLRAEQPTLVRHVQAEGVRVADLSIRQEIAPVRGASEGSAIAHSTSSGSGGAQGGSSGSSERTPDREAQTDDDPSAPEPSRGRVRFVL